MLPSVSSKGIGERSTSAANAPRDPNTNRSKAEVAGLGLDFDATLNVQQNSRAGYGFKKNAVDAQIPSQTASFANYFAKAKQCIGYIPHGENVLSLRIASPELIPGNLEDLHKFYEDPVTFSAAGKRSNVSSLAADETFPGFKTQDLGPGVFLPSIVQDEVLEAVEVVRYNVELPFPYVKGRSPYSIDEESDSGDLSAMEGEQEARHAAYRTYLDEMIGAQLKSNIG